MRANEARADSGPTEPAANTVEQDSRNLWGDDGGDYGPLTKEHKKALERGTRCEPSAYRNDLLDMAKIEQESFEMMEPVSLTIIGNDVLEMLRDKATQNSVTLEFQDPSEPIYLVTDNRRIRQMLLNLVGNAVKFTPEGGRVTLRIATAEAWVSLSVQDTGIGIAPEELPRMFEAFTQVDSTQQRKHAGTGLGLNLTATLAKVLGGELKAESTPGQGSTFTIVLPNRAPSKTEITTLREEEALARAKKPEAPVVRVKPPEKEPPAQVPPSAEQVPAEPVDPDSLHVLLVDDTAANIGHLRDFLLSKGHQYRPLQRSGGHRTSPSAT